MPDKKLTEELLNELLDVPSIDGYIREHDFAAPSLSDYLKQLLQEKGLERSRVVRMALEWQLHPNTSHIHPYMYG